MPRLNRLHNRSSGVIRHGPHSGPDVPHPSDDPKLVKASRDRISPALKGMLVSIDSLTLDPQNCRLHPERNLKAICDSLVLYGQKHPIVARKGTDVVVAGNGRLMAARKLGWTVMAAVFEEMTDGEAYGYGIADNRTAELARWDYKAMGILDALRRKDAEWCLVGYNSEELAVLRQADWTPPPSDVGEVGGTAGSKNVSLSLTPEQADVFRQAVDAVRQSGGNNGLGDVDCLLIMCVEWIKARGD